MAWTFNQTNTGRNGTIQSWTVPEGGIYRITAYGAQGGTFTWSTNRSGGKGARMTGDFFLEKDDALKILVGQMGGNGGSGTYSYAAGGGGGTFVVKDSDELLIAAGGGGGAGGHLTHSNMHGTTEINGKDGRRGPTSNDNSLSSRDSSGAGGTNGNGGSSVGDGGGGAGWKTNSTGNYTAYRFLEGGAGGQYSTSTNYGDGGFGGGGAGENASGGGGGYSGGGGGQWAYAGCGGGGGSYNAGANQSNSSGSRSGDGFVKIEVISGARTPFVTNRHIYSVTLNSQAFDPQITGDIPRYFEYGPTTSYGTVLDAGTYDASILDFKYDLSGLEPNTTYHFRPYIICNGTRYNGVDVTFTTRSGLAILSTDSVASISAETAQANGTIIGYDE